MKRKLQLAAMALMAFTGLRSQTASCLNFDGTGSYVDCGNILTASYTKEAWVNINYAGIANNIISGGSAGQHAFWASSGYGYKLSAGHNGTWNLVQDPTPLAAGTWYHVAVTYDAASNTMILYKNGVAVSSNIGGVPPYNGGNLLQIGAYDPGNNLYSGDIDEVRIWNYARTAADIQLYMNCELNTGITPPGLIAYYNFNEGIAAAANPGVTTLFDMSGNSFDGSLNNFALTGSTSNWISGSPVLSTPVLTVSGTNTLCAGSSAVEVVNGATTYSWSTAATTASVSVSPTVSTTYTVWAIGTNSCVASSSVNVYVNGITPVSATTTSSIICAGQTPTITAMPATSYGLSLNGTNAYLDASTNINIPINNDPYTLEAWVKPNSVSGANGIIGWGAWGNTNQTNALRFNGSTQIINYWWSNDLVVSCPNVLDGFWHHIAATFDGVTRKIYMDGVLLGSDYPSGHNVPSANNLAIGTTYNYSEFFDGLIDDVRIWNMARTQTDIADNMNNCLKGSEAGLVALYAMNDGTGSSIVTDLSASANTATLTNMVPATDWVAGYNNCDVNYMWTPSSATTQVISVTPSVTTTYTVNFTSFAGCTTSTTKMITVDTPTLAITGATAVCTGNSATLTASGANTYTWSTSANTTSIVVSPTIAATYSLSGTSLTGCTSTVSAVQTVTVFALPTLSVVTSNSMLCTGQTATLTASGATTYTWSTSANTAAIPVTPTTNATYTVVGTNGNGCMNATVITQSVSTCSGINEQAANASVISIYPNPNNGTFNLQMNAANGNNELVILNAIGQKVHTQTIEQGTNVITTSGLAKGIYQYVLMSNSRPAGAGKLVIE